MLLFNMKPPFQNRLPMRAGSANKRLLKDEASDDPSPVRKAPAQCFGKFNMDLHSCQDKSLTLSNPIFRCRRVTKRAFGQKTGTVDDRVR